MYQQQNYNYYPQQQPLNTNQNFNSQYLRQAPPQTGLKGKMVSSLDEVRATSIDFDGSIFYFPDLANKLIYTKQINMDGTATLNVYELKEMPKEELARNIPIDQFVTKEELEAILNQLRQDLKPAPSQSKSEILNF